jgi:hypothetical protein
MSYDKTNPKDKIGMTKAPLRLVPPALMIEVAEVMADGAKKYGPYNWRDTNVRLTVYLEAMLRHILAVLDGEDYTQDSGVKHIAAIAAGCGIVLDAQGSGTLIDDRPTKGPAPSLLNAQETGRGSKAVAKGKAAIVAMDQGLDLTLESMKKVKENLITEIQNSPEWLAQTSPATEKKLPLHHCYDGPVATSVGPPLPVHSDWGASTRGSSDPT